MKIQLGYCTPLDTDDADEFTASELQDRDTLEKNIITFYSPKISNGELWNYRTPILIFPEIKKGGNVDADLLDIARAVAPHWRMDEYRAYWLLCTFATVYDTDQDYATWRGWEEF
jgi:hypothetical protein